MDISPISVSVLSHTRWWHWRELMSAANGCLDSRKQNISALSAGHHAISQLAHALW
jgi:hypothetical protein